MGMAKETVEDSKFLDVLEYAKKGYLRDGTSGTSYWPPGEQETESIGWLVAGGAFHLTYTQTRRDGSKVHYSYPVFLAHTRATIGGERVWFTCPRCGRRVRKLYLPPSAGRFWCRGCHGLSYRSRQRRMSLWDRERKLEKELLTLPSDSRRWRRKLRELERVQDSLPYIDSIEEAFRSPPAAPKRGPGRPSKREIRERAQAERETAKAAAVKRPRGRPRLKRTYVRRKPLLLSERKGDMEAYCVKCRDRRELKDPKPVTLANGRPALMSTCPVCATLLTRIVKAGEETAQG
jgi:Domain of unknown function (DUF5679)